MSSSGVFIAIAYQSNIVKYLYTNRNGKISRVQRYKNKYTTENDCTDNPSEIFLNILIAAAIRKIAKITYNSS